MKPAFLYWIIGGLCAIIMPLTALAWNGHETRITGLELFKDAALEHKVTDARELAAITAKVDIILQQNTDIKREIERMRADRRWEK